MMRRCKGLVSKVEKGYPSNVQSVELPSYRSVPSESYARARNTLDSSTVARRTFRY